MISSYEQEISSFKISFIGATTTEAVETHRKKLIEQLTIKQRDFIQTLNSVNIIDQDSRIANAVQSKVERIHQAAEQQLRLLKEHAQLTVEYYIQQINFLEVTFIHATTANAVEIQRQKLIHELELLITDKDDLVQALRTLGITGQHPEIISALADKKRLIQREAGQRLENLEQEKEELLKQTFEQEKNEALRIITNYEHQINSVEISFHKITTPEAIEEHSQELMRRLDDIVRNSHELSYASQTLEGKTQHSRITKAIEAKTQSIHQATREQLQRLYEVETVMLDYERQISSFSFDLSNFTAQELIETHGNNLIQQVERIIKNKADLIQAQQTLGINGTAPKIKAALTNKIQAIRSATQQQADAQQQAERIIQRYELEINSFSITVLTQAKTIQEVDQLSKTLIFQLENKIINKADLNEPQALLGLTRLHPGISSELTNKRQIIRDESQRIKNKIVSHEAAVKTLEETQFAKHLSVIENMAVTMEQKAQTNENYTDAAKAARSLHNKLFNAQEEFLSSGKPHQANVAHFKENCLQAIIDELPVLEEHRGWKQVLADIASTILSIATLGIINLATGRWGLFAPQTNSAQTTKEFEAVCQTIRVSA